ncbi:MAG TPA: type VI secretion system protein TssA [Candidatus Binataceae bacterium]|nr:type VI secretion system protein TssA [Candidatus Binataceae bacterium]
MSDSAAQPPAVALDLEVLLAPSAGPSGTGPDLRFDPIYSAIVEARREENLRLPQGVWTREIKRSDWPLVEQLCGEVLRERSKDLQVASWLTEAWIHRRGFAGLAPGLRLLAALCRRFWPDLHPQIDEGDLGPRLAPFEWLNTRIPILLRNLPVVVAAGNADESYTWTDYVNAQLLEGLRQRDPKAVERSEAAGAVTLAAFATVRTRTETKFWNQMNAGLAAARSALIALDEVLATACGRDAPGLGAIADALRDLSNLASAALSERQPPTLPQRLFARVSSNPAAAPAGAPPPAIERPTRENAYARLLEIADLLQALEPHSPVPYLIRRAIEWGDMSFAQLVMNFSHAGLQLDQLIDVLGLGAMADEAEDAAGDRRKP